MSGTAVVTHTRDWLTPYQIEVDIEGRQPSTTRFAAAAKAQEYVLRIADEHNLLVEYRLDEPEGEPREITAEEFTSRMTRICNKCKRSKPIADYRPLFHVNRHTARGQRILHGWAERCADCEAEHGE